MAEKPLKFPENQEIQNGTERQRGATCEQGRIRVDARAHQRPLRPGARPASRRDRRVQRIIKGPRKDGAYRLISEPAAEQ